MEDVTPSGPTPSGPPEPKATPSSPPPEQKTDTEDAVESKKQNRRRKKKQSITGRRVQTFGKKKHAIAIALCGDGHGMIRVNGKPLDLIEPKPLRLKVYEPFLLVGKDKYQDLDIHIRVRGGGHVAQIYAVRQAIAKALLAFHAKYIDEASKQELRKTFLQYDRNLLIADPRRRESKKFGGPGPRSRYQKSYR
eukprot:UN00793